MTASSNWWKAAVERWLLALPLGLLAACGSSPAPDTGVTPLPRPKPVPSAAAAPSASAAAATGLTPLPTTQQVVTAVPLGRPDPFAPPPVAVATRGPVQLALPAGFRFSGVIVTGGQAQALVQLGANSGSLRVGDRGGRSTDLLPAGWSVARIDVQRGVLTLRQGKRNLAVEL